MHASNDGLSSPLAATFFAADRWRGDWLDKLGLGPHETPWRSVDVAAGMRLHCYDGAREPAAVPILLVPAPIKQPYIWDLLPRISVVRRCLEAGLRVYLAAWPAPKPGQRDGGLAEYADEYLAACLRVIAAEAGEPPPFLIGHSLGGTLAALFASLHPERVGGLVLLEAPLKFGRDAGAFAPLLAAAPSGGAIVTALGGVPGTFLNAVALAAAPDEFLWWPWRDAVASAGDAEAAMVHLLVRRWTLDEVPMPARLFEEVADQLYRSDAFARGTLRIGGRPALPERLANLPVAAVVDPESRLVPPGAALSLLPTAEQFHYAGETGIGLRHVGVLVGRQAHAELWPQLTEWIGRQAHPRDRSRPHLGAGKRSTRAASALIRSRARQQ
jgi:polyhydroxyalkanoate synthase